MSETIEPKNEGKIPSAIDAIVKLVKADPLLALVAIFGILPLLGGIASASLQGKPELLPLLLIVLTVIILIICVPLIIVRTWQDTQYSMKDERTSALKTEAKKRLIDAENTQKRFNQLVEAKIKNLAAQTSLALSASDRAEREQLFQIVDELREVLKSKGIDTVDTATCTENVHKILQELATIQIDYDRVLEAIKTIEQTLNAESKEHPPVEEGSVEDISQQLFDWKANYESLEAKYADAMKRIDNYQADIEHLAADIKGGAENYQLLQTERDKLEFAYEEEYQKRLELEGKAEPEEYVPKKEDLNIITHGELPATDGTVIKDEPLKEALSILDNLSDRENDGLVDKVKSVIQSAKDVAIGIVPSVLKLDEEKPITADPSNFENDVPDEIFSPDISELSTAKTPPPEPVKDILDLAPYWICPKCDRGNDNKKVRCPQCGSSKPS